MGAAAPSRSATVAGIKKIDDAIVTLMMLAVSSRVPMARTSCASGEALAVIRLADFSFRQLVLQHDHRQNEIHLPPAVAAAVDVERSEVPDVPVLHLLPDSNADVDAFRKALIEAEKLALPFAKLIHRRRRDRVLPANRIQHIADRSQLGPVVIIASTLRGCRGAAGFARPTPPHARTREGKARI